MVEQFRQPHQCHISVFPCALKDLAPESLSHGVGAEMLDLQIVFLFNLLEKDIDALSRVHDLFVREEAFLVAIGDVQCFIAISNVLLEIVINLYDPAFACFLLIEGEVVIIQEHRPSESTEVANT